MVVLRWRGVMGSELLKLCGVRSTAWCALLSIIVSALIAVSVAAGAQSTFEVEQDRITTRSLQATALTDGMQIVALIVAVVSTLLVTSEFTTGSIRSTLAAVPTRFPVFIGKAVAVSTFASAVGLSAVFAAGAVSGPILAGKGYQVDYLDVVVVGSALRSVAFLILTALIALGLGALGRSTVGGLALTFALMQAAPLTCGVVGGALRSMPVQSLALFFPANAAGRSFYELSVNAPQFSAEGALQLDTLQGLCVLLAWLAASSVLATVTFTRLSVR